MGVSKLSAKVFFFKVNYSFNSHKKIKLKLGDGFIKKYKHNIS